MVIRIRLFFLAALFSLFVYVQPSAYGADAHMVDIEIRDHYSTISVSAHLKGAFTPEIEEAFMSGMPVTFTYLVNLYRSRNYWWDAKETSLKVHKMVKYDSFKKEFHAIEFVSEKTPNGEDFEKLLTDIREERRASLFSPAIGSLNRFSQYLVLKDLATLEDWMSSLHNLPIGEKIDLPANRKYYAEVKAEMKTIKLTPPFNYIFFFVSFLNFDTEWEASSPFLIESPNMPIQSMVGFKKNK